MRYAAAATAEWPFPRLMIFASNRYIAMHQISRLLPPIANKISISEIKGHVSRRLALRAIFREFVRYRPRAKSATCESPRRLCEKQEGKGTNSAVIRHTDVFRARGLRIRPLDPAFTGRVEARPVRTRRPYESRARNCHPLQPRHAEGVPPFKTPPKGCHLWNRLRGRAAPDTPHILHGGRIDASVQRAIVNSP